MIAKDLLCTVCGRPYDNRSGWHSLLVPIAPAPVTTKAVLFQSMWSYVTRIRRGKYENRNYAKYAKINLGRH